MHDGEQQLVLFKSHQRATGFKSEDSENHSKTFQDLYLPLIRLIMEMLHLVGHFKTKH